ncbi:hypothetical protein Y032_0023g745 [Ancylostoma ceylanicum]|uniref:Uncharacterized protein n=1 Tax=Ancylostoma ceylanicum TaxID=53326 RepID=A0A016UZD7_9BILA|nr:hypothetical protein Y032_0023g745 [Ancylostoma ceylanicum]
MCLPGKTAKTEDTKDEKKAKTKGKTAKTEDSKDDKKGKTKADPSGKCVGIRSRRIANDTYRSSSESDVSGSDVDRYVSLVIRQDRTPRRKVVHVVGWRGQYTRKNGSAATVHEPCPFNRYRSSTGGFGGYKDQGSGWKMDRAVQWCRFFEILRTKTKNISFVSVG